MLPHVIIFSLNPRTEMIISYHDAAMTPPGALVIGRTSLARSHVAAGAHSESHGMCHLEALAAETAGSGSGFPKLIGGNIL